MGVIIQLLHTFFKDKNDEIDELIIIGCIGMLTMCFLEGWSVIMQGHEFGAHSFGIGFSAVMVAMWNRFRESPNEGPPKEK